MLDPLPRSLPLSLPSYMEWVNPGDSLLWARGCFAPISLKGRSCSSCDVGKKLAWGMCERLDLPFQMESCVASPLCSSGMSWKREKP